MFLLSDADVAQGATALACTFAFISGLFAYLKNKDDKKFDLRVAKLEEGLAECNKRHDTEKTITNALKSTNERQQKELNDLKIEIETLNKRAESSRKDRKVMRHVIEKLREALAQTGARTDSAEFNIPDSDY